MARPQDLPYGAIAPSARPVDAFIQPANKELMAQPQAPELFGAPKGVTQVGTAGTTFVQGSNSFRDLAAELAPFSDNLIKFTANAGLKFAAWQMDVGERQAMEQGAEAAARLDEEVETSELNRAAANRSLSMQDPQAGFVMNLLNPYRGIGYKRGMSKRAGREIENGMAGYVASQSGRIDYTSPDQGFGALQSIRAEYTNTVLDRYGVDSASPGFSKYVAPRIERASDAVAQNLQKDRVNWLDDQKPRTTAALVQKEWQSITTNNEVAFNGTTYRLGDPGYEAAVGLRLNQIASAELMTGGLPGQQAKWEKDVFQILAATGDYRDGGVSPLDYLRSRTPVVGNDGKQKTDAIGQPQFYTWRELYSQESIDSEIKYGQAAYKATTRQRTEMQRQLSTQIVEGLVGVPPGPERQQLLTDTVNTFIRSYEERYGTMDSATRSFLYEAADKAGKITFGNPSQFDDPNVVSSYVAQIKGSVGVFDGAAARRELDLAANATADPTLRQQLLTQGLAAITEREKQEDVAKNYGTTYGDILDRTVDAALQREYQFPTPKNNKNRPIAEENMRGVYEPVIQETLRNKELELGRRLTQQEAAQFTREAIKSITPDQLDGVFPQGNTERTQQREQQSSAAPTSSEPKPAPTPTYSLQGLASIPNRRVVLRQYETVRFLDSSAIAKAVENSYLSYDQPRSLLRAYRDSGARNLYEFVNSQYELLKQQVPNYEPTWTDQQWLRFKTRSQRTSGLERGAYSTANLAQSSPMLASIQESMVSIPFGV